MRRGLEAPFYLAILRVDRDARGGPLVVAGAQPRVPGRGIAGAEIGELGVWIVGAAEPRSAASELVHVARPAFIGLAGHRRFLALIRAGQALEHRAGPNEFARVDLPGFDAAHD